MPAVQTILPFQPQAEKERVAAYCRVSSDSADQLNSYRAQIAYYTDLIGKNPNWELADIYADEGITGTSMEKREAFQRMMEDARAGKIDRILVKSVSRFARNYIEQLETTRELAKLGVVVEFEEQHINTSQMLGEMQLTLHAVAAENESRAISQNIKWSIQKRMQNGSFCGTKTPVGYIFKGGTLAPNELEEGIVKDVFRRYLAGEGKQSIARRLNEQAEKLPRGSKHWTAAHIDYILTNERYVGDKLLQKYISTAAFPPRKKENEGEAAQYYVRESHPAIITRDSFEAVQRLYKTRRTSYVRKASNKFHIFCPVCNHTYRMQISSGKVYWTCCNSESGRSRCNAPRIQETKILMGWLNLIGKLYSNYRVIIGKPLSLLREMQFHENGNQKLYELDSAISECKEKALSLQKLHNKGFLDDEEYHTENEKLAVQRQKLTEERRRKLSGSKTGKLLADMEALQDELAGWDFIPTEFDIDTFDRIVERIVPSDGKLCFRLRCGISLWEDLP